MRLFKKRASSSFDVKDKTISEIKEEAVARLRYLSMNSRSSRSLDTGTPRRIIPKFVQAKSRLLLGIEN